MKKNVTTKVLDKAIQITKQFGYWSEEVKEFLAQFDYNARLKLHYAIKNISKE